MHMPAKNLHKEIIKAAEILRSGGLVAFPTDTVYGLGADAKNPMAMAKVFSVKNRPTDRPLIVLLRDISQVKDWTDDFSPAAQALAQQFWPGPLTLILPSAGQTIGLRIPNHPLALALLKEFGGGIATTSANRSGQQSLLQADQVSAELGHTVDMILEGECLLGVESTIVDVSQSQPKILRIGAISKAEINRVLGSLLS